MPQRIFVPGPSVNPNLIGSPASFLKNINDVSAGNRRARIADERTANDKLFKEQTAALNERKQDFTEAAPVRAEEQRLAGLARENEKISLVQNMSEGLQFAGGDRFDTIRGELEKDPRFNTLDDAGKLAAQNKFIQDNPSALTSPTRFRDELTKNLTASGKFTGAEIQAHVANQVSQKYPTADPDIIKSLLAKPDFKIGSGSTVNVNGQRTGGAGNFSLIADPTNPTERGTVVDRISETFGLEANPDTIFGQRIDIGDLDATKQDVSQAVSFLSTADINSPTAQEAAINLAFNDDGTLKEKFNWKTKAGKKNLIAEARKAQGAEERIFNKKGGDLSRIGASTGQSATDVAAAAEAYNDRLLSRLTPRSLSDSGVASAFLDNLGAPQNNTRQGGSGDGGVIAPVAPAPVPAAVPSAVEQEIIAGQDTPAEFNIGGQVPGEVVRDRIFDLIQGAIPPAPHEILADGVTGAADFAQNTVAPAAGKLFDSLTPPGPGVLDPGPPQVELDSEDLNTIPDGQRPALEAAAREAFANGDISLDDAPSGGTIQEKILIAYLRSLEGSRN